MPPLEQPVQKAEANKVLVGETANTGRLNVLP